MMRQGHDERETAAAAYEHLDALERRGDELEAWHEANDQAQAYIRKQGTDALVTESKQAREDKRRIRLGTINTLILLAHIDRLEAELAKPPLWISRLPQLCHSRRMRGFASSWPFVTAP